MWYFVWYSYATQSASHIFKRCPCDEVFYISTNALGSDDRSFGKIEHVQNQVEMGPEFCMSCLVDYGRVMSSVAMATLRTQREFCHMKNSGRPTP